MTFTVAERITKNVVSTLGAIRVQNLCRFDATAEEQSSTTNSARDDVYFMISEGEPVPSDDGPINFDDYEVEYTITYTYVSAEARADRTPAGLRAEVFSEAKKALMRDETRSGLAIRTFGWGHSARKNGGSGDVGGDVTFTVHFRTLQDDPFASAFES